MSELSPTVELMAEYIALNYSGCPPWPPCGSTGTCKGCWTVTGTVYDPAIVINKYHELTQKGHADIQKVKEGETDV